eukprot:14224131-Ditylum_brightwellii.AAC.1
MTTGTGKNAKDITILLQHLYSWAQDASLWDTIGDVTTNAANAAFVEDVLKCSEDMHRRFILKQV